MKTRGITRLVSLVLAILVSVSFINMVIEAQTRQEITLLEAKTRLIRQIYQGDIGRHALFASPSVKMSGARIASWREPARLTVDRDSWFFYVDEEPGANWEHQARYVLVDRATGAVNSVAVRTPPMEILEMETQSPVAVNQMTILRQNYRLVLARPLQLAVIEIPREPKYAVLVSGGWNATYNYGRYWNDLAFIYKALKEKYGYTDAQIIVLYANGSHSPNNDLDGDGTNDVDYSATKANLTTVMNQVRNNIETDGEFFFYATNHGGQEVDGTHEAILYLWGEWIRDDEFAALTQNIRCAKAFYVMEQCFSGGMMDDILTAQTYPCTNPRVCVITAANYNESSWACDTEGQYDEYVYHWTSAIYGQTPGGTSVNADTDGDGLVSMSEAHQYALNRDSRNEHPTIGSCIADACGLGLAPSLILRIRPLQRRP